MMRRIWIVLWVALVVAAVAGCGRQAPLSVNELLDSGSKYDGQTVTVQGKVTLTISGVLNMIKVDDLVTLNINGSLPPVQDGDTVTASGKYASENRAIECSSQDVKKIQ